MVAPEEVLESVPAIEPEPPIQTELAPNWPDEAAESSFLAEGRRQGEEPTAIPVKETVVEEGESNALPPLDDLIARIPAEVREILDDLFRARFVAVKRLPRKALKR